MGKAVLLGFVLVAGALAQPYWVDRVAGNYSAPVDGVPAKDVPLGGAEGLAFDSAGILYIADSRSDWILRVEKTGVVTTVAGTGHAGFSGDEGPATNASLNHPMGIAFDRQDSLYIADCVNDRVRKVNGAGIITTVAGTGRATFSGDGGPATDAGIDCPAGLAFDAEGNLFFSEYWNHRIRKIDSAGIITTVAGTGDRGFDADGGPATDASLNNPYGIALDRSGNLFIADRTNRRIRKVDSAGIITTVAGTGNCCFSGDGGPATEARLSLPNSVAFDLQGDLYLADHGNDRIRKVTSAGTITTVAGGGDFGGDCGQASGAPVDPVAVVADSSGRIYFFDWSLSAVRRLSSERPVECSAPHTPLATWSVSPGEVSFAGFRSRGCLVPSGSRPQGQTYVVHSSEWQRMAPGETDWTTVDGTLRVGRICAHTPTAPGQYRAVAKMSVGAGERAAYRSSNQIAGPPRANTEPSFGNTAIADQTYVVGTAISPLALPRATGGDGSITYSLSPSVPGLALNASTLRLAGTPAAAGSYAMSYIARDADGDTASLRFTVTVNEQSGGAGGGDYTPLDGWTVSDGRVRFLFSNAGGCISLGDGSTINGTTYIVHSSKWQRRAGAADAWTDVAGTERTGQLCSYSPTEPGQYRGVAEISIGGTRGRYSSKNILTVESGTGPQGGSGGSGQTGGDYTPLDGWTVSDGRVRFLFSNAGGCISLGDGSTINGTTYIVHSSKWQRRAGAADAWTDVAGTERTGQLCSYSPTEPGQYRGVAEISIGGTRGRYSSKNILTVESGTGSQGSSGGSGQSASGLSAVTGLRVTARDDDAVLAWNPVDGAEYYKVYHCQTVGESIGPCELKSWYDLIAERVTGTTYRDSGRLESSVIPWKHYYQVRPCDQSGCLPL